MQLLGRYGRARQGVISTQGITTGSNPGKLVSC